MTLQSAPEKVVMFFVFVVFLIFFELLYLVMLSMVLWEVYSGRSSVTLWNPGVEVPNDWEKMVCSDTLLPLNAITGTGIDCSK